MPGNVEKSKVVRVKMIKFYDLQALTRLHADEYKSAISRVVDSGWFLLGEETSRFEASFARYIGADDSMQCVAVGNGLDALTLMLRGYMELGQIREGDEVIVPSNTYIATILAITRNGLKPILVEPWWESLVLDTDRVEAAITPRTRAVLTVHLYGRLACDNQLRDICRRHGLRLLEDCAQSHGCRGDWGMTGALGDAAAFSFYPGKNLGAFGDAGAVLTRDPELATVIRALGNYGSDQKYRFKYQGVNSRISEVDAAVLQVRLQYLDSDNRKRQELASRYYDGISNPLVTLPSRLPDYNNVYHLFPILCQYRDDLQRHLSDCGIQTLIHYPIPPHRQQCYSGWEQLQLPVSERIHASELSLPMSPVVSLEDCARIIESINSFRK